MRQYAAASAKLHLRTNNLRRRALLLSIQLDSRCRLVGATFALLRHRGRGRERGEVAQARPVRHRLVLRIRQYLSLFGVKTLMLEVEAASMAR
jgi:hypothetical protein